MFLQLDFAEITIIVGLLMFSCDLLARYCGAELIYSTILAVRGRTLESRLIKAHKPLISIISCPSTCHLCWT